MAAALQMLRRLVFRRAKHRFGEGAIQRRACERSMLPAVRASVSSDISGVGPEMLMAATAPRCSGALAEPVICIDEKSLQIINHSRQPLAAAPHCPAKLDYEYVRNGTTNLFVAVEPKAGQRGVSVTAHRGKADFVAFIEELLTGVYALARDVHLVLDNLNTRFRKCFDDVLGQRAINKLLRRVEVHYTSKHASWLNMAEIEIGILSRQCLDRRIADRETLQTEVDAWQQARNAERHTIEWSFTRQDADRKLGRHHVSKITC